MSDSREVLREYSRLMISECYIATAPPGRWSHGPYAIYTGDKSGLEIVQSYREMGWNVIGPYKLVDENQKEESVEGENNSETLEL